MRNVRDVGDVLEVGELVEKSATDFVTKAPKARKCEGCGAKVHTGASCPTCGSRFWGGKALALVVKGLRKVRPHARGGRPVAGYAQSVPEQHQRKIAQQTMKMHCAGAAIMGGPDHHEAARILGVSPPAGCTCGAAKGTRQIKPHTRGGKPVRGYTQSGKYGLKVDYRKYRCMTCGHEHDVQTNHTGPLQVRCPNCSWKGGGHDMTADISGYRGAAVPPTERPHVAVEEVGPRRIATTYEVVTPESAEAGDAAERGWDNEEGESMEPDEYDLEEALTATDKAATWLRNQGVEEASSSQFHPGVWYTSSVAQDRAYFEKSEERRQSFHLRGFSQEEERTIHSKLFGKKASVGAPSVCVHGMCTKKALPGKDRCSEHSAYKAMTGGYNVKCSTCGKSYSSAQDFHTHVKQGCKKSVGFAQVGAYVRRGRAVKPYIRSYTEAVQYLGNRARRRVSGNTYAERRGEDVAIKYHATDVVTFHKDDTATLKTGGWHTVTTKRRMAQHVPAAGIHQSRHEWMTRSGAPFFEGMRVNVGTGQQSHCGKCHSPMTIPKAGTESIHAGNVYCHNCAVRGLTGVAKSVLVKSTDTLAGIVGILAHLDVAPVEDVAARLTAPELQLFATGVKALVARAQAQGASATFDEIRMVDGLDPSAAGRVVRRLFGDETPGVALVVKGSDAKVHRVLHEFKHGELRSGSKKGPKVTKRKQAVAIAMSEAGLAKKG